MLPQLLSNSPDLNTNRTQGSLRIEMAAAVSCGAGVATGDSLRQGSICKFPLPQVEHSWQFISFDLHPLFSGCKPRRLGSVFLAKKGAWDSTTESDTVSALLPGLVQPPPTQIYPLFAFPLSSSIPKCHFAIQQYNLPWHFYNTLQHFMTPGFIDHRIGPKIYLVRLGLMMNPKDLG